MTLLEKAKANLMVTHHFDDELISEYLSAAKKYAEEFQHLPDGYYDLNPMSSTTEQAVIMFTAFLYESRDGSTGGFWGDNTNAPASAFVTVNNLLRMGRDWKV
jgi:hypothetical protein